MRDLTEKLWSYRTYNSASDDLTAEEIADKMIECCDKNHDNLLTKDEFVTTFMEDPVLFGIFCRTT
jgi:Ca2+-binding EF-hand superfamily protein